MNQEWNSGLLVFWKVKKQNPVGKSAQFDTIWLQWLPHAKKKKKMIRDFVFPLEIYAKII